MPLEADGATATTPESRSLVAWVAAALFAGLGVWLVINLTTAGDDSFPSDSGVYCYLADDSALILVRLTLNPKGDVSGLAKWSIDRGATFDRTVTFQGRFTRHPTGATMNLDASWLSNGEKIDVTESWSFSDDGFWTGNRRYDQVECSVIEATFLNRD